jgi:hypothetical protein
VEPPDQRARDDEAALGCARIVEEARQAIEQAVGERDDVAARRRGDVDANGFHEFRVARITFNG